VRRIAILALASAAACTPMQWHKPDVTAEQLRADEEECRSRAWREASLHAWQYQSVWGPAFARDPYGRGVTVWPSGPMMDPYGYQMLEENRLTQFCMEAKGYRLAPAPEQ
jgi:hypothetical protein